MSNPKDFINGLEAIDEGAVSDQRKTFEEAKQHFTLSFVVSGNKKFISIHAV